MTLDTKDRVGWTLGSISIGFALIIAIVWLIDITRLFGLLPSLHPGSEVLELGIDTLIILIVAVPMLLIVRSLLYRVQYLEEFMSVCAWCKKVNCEGRWISYPEFMETRFRTSTSHGICPPCAGEMRD